MPGKESEDESLRRQRFILDHANEFLTLINRDYVYVEVNASYCAAMEKPYDEVIGRSVAEIWGEERFESTIRPYLERCFAGETVSYIERFQFGAAKRYMHVSYYPYSNDATGISHVLVSSHDITHLGELEEMLMNYEYRDPVTGLFNRKSLEILLEVELLKAQRSSSAELRALLFIGIENLPEISRRHGYDIGDHIFENTGIRVKEMVRESDYVFRFRGNELAVILSRLAGEADAEKVAEKIMQVIAMPYRFKETDIVLTCRSGAAVYPTDGTSTEGLIRNASAALAEAVRDSRLFKRFDSGAHKRASRRLTTESQLRRAFEQEQFELYFQPIIRATGGIEGAEALIRWNLPSRGIVRPNEFLPIACEIGMMDAISRWTIFAATRQIARLGERFPIYLTVNLTAQAFESEELPKTLETAINQAKAGILPSRLRLEITETDAMLRADAAAARIRDFQQCGYEVYIDDFGTGHSSLAYLRNLPANTVKIDKSFVDSIAAEGNDEPFVKYIVELLKIKGKRVIAEGVSTIEQVERLRAMGCDSFQGFYFAEPLPYSAFESFLERNYALSTRG